MSWLDKLLGREAAPEAPAPAKGWASSSPQTRAATADAYLLAVAARAGVAAPQLVPHPPSDGRSELRGTLRGLPLRVIVTHGGDLDELNLRYARSGGFIDLSYDRELEATPPPAVEAWEPSDKKVFLAPGIYTSGSSADKEAAAFRQLPAPLQAKVLAEIKRLRIRYFRSRPDNHDVGVFDDVPEVADPEAWLADVLALSGEVAAARGAAPSGPTAAGEAAAAAADSAFATELAAKLATRIPGARIVRRDEDRCIDVRFVDSGVPARIVLDVRCDDLDVEAYARDVSGELEVCRDPDVEVDAPVAGAEVWDEVDAVLFLAPAIHVTGSEPDVRRAGALLHGLPPALLDELVATIEELEISSLILERQTLTLTACDLDCADAAERGPRLARLLARVAAALPRSVDAYALGRAVRCFSCHGLYVPTGSRAGCPRCAAG